MLFIFFLLVFSDIFYSAVFLSSFPISQPTFSPSYLTSLLTTSARGCLFPGLGKIYSRKILESLGLNMHSILFICVRTKDAGECSEEIQ